MITRVTNVPSRGVGFPDGRGMIYRGLSYNLSLGCSLVLDLPHNEGTGSMVFDTSPYHQDMIAVGWPAPPVPGWFFLPSGQPAIAYDGVHNYGVRPAGASTPLNFTSQDFTLLMWCGSMLAGGSYMLMTQGKVDVCGWEFYLTGGVNTISLRTNQAGSHTGISAIGAFIPGMDWKLIGVTRRRSGGQFYVNGQPVATTLGSGLLDPVSGAGHEFMAGKGELGNYFEGAISITRIWARQLSDDEMESIFNTERSLFGV